MISLRTARQNRAFTGKLMLRLRNGQGPYPLAQAPASYELRLFRHNNTTPFATATVANGKMTVGADAASTIISYSFPAGDMANLLGYGSMELVSTVAGSAPECVAPLMFVKESTPYTRGEDETLVIWQEDIVVLVEASLQLVVNPTATGLAVLQAADAAAGRAALSAEQAGTAAAAIAAHAGASDPHPQYASDADLAAALADKAPLLSPALAGTPTAPTAAPGTSTTQIASTAFVAAAVAAGGDATGTLTGAAALDLLPVHLRGRKALVLDLAGNGYAAFNDGAAAAMGALESYASATLTNSTGGLRWTRKRVLASVSADALRLTHDYLGRPAGALFEAAFAYLHPYSQPTVAQLSNGSNVTDATAPEGWSGNWIGFGDNSLQRFSYLGTQATTTGQEYCAAFLIRMDDGGAPVPGLTIGTGDFLCASSPPPLKPSDGTSGFDITGPFADNVYQVSWYAVSTGATIRPPSPIKYTGQSARGFRIGHRMFGPGRYPPSFMEATGTAPSRAADVLSLPVTGFAADEITLAGAFTAPQPEATVRTVFCLKNGADKLEMNFASGSMAPVIKLIVGGVEQFGGTAAALTPGTAYTFHVSASRTDKLLRWKFSGLAAGSVGPTTPLTATSAFTPAALDVGNAGGAAQLSSAIRSLSLIDRAWTAAEGESFTDAGVAVASLSYAMAALSADVQLTTSNTFFDGPSVTLAAGTWLLSAQAQYQKTTTTASQVTVRLHDGVNTIADQNKYHASLNGITLGFHLSDIVVLAAPATITLQMATTVGNAASLMKAQAPNNGSGANATIINAVRLA